MDGVETGSRRAVREPLAMVTAVHVRAADETGGQAAAEERKDYFISRDGKVFAGTHLILDLCGARHLDDIVYIEHALTEAVEAAKATLLEIRLHHFSPNGGVSAVAVLAESHISIHTWPEAAYAAVDIFMCGNAEPHKSATALTRAFQPTSVELQEFYRGEQKLQPSPTVESSEG
jgi:S-adenosylmethionine decarboxylase